jgi:outer membrane protein assembly factor BamA
MRRISAIAVILIEVSLSCAQAMYDRVEFHGAHEFSSGQLADFLGIAPKTSVSPDSLDIRLAALQDSLAERDYLFSGVDSVATIARKGRARLHVYLHEGPLARVSSYRWLGDSSRVAPGITSHCFVREGGTFHWSDLDADIVRLLDYFENNGYPFARVEISRIDPDSAEAAVSVRLKIASGPLTKLDFVSFAGNRQTRTTFLMRETRLQPGQLYVQRALDLARRRLQRLDFVRAVEAPELVVNTSGETGVEFRLDETRTTFIDIAAGYQPARDNQPGQVSGLANLDFLNLFGSGRRGRVHWERPNSSVQDVQVSYAEPWVLGQPVSVQGDFGQRIQDTLYVLQHFGVKASIDLSTQLSVWGLARREAIFADSSASVQLGLPDSRTTYLETGLSIDTRDEPLNPRGGVYFSSFIGSGWRERDAVLQGAPSGSYRQRRGGVDSEIAHELFPFWIAFAGVHARAITSTEPEILVPDLYRLGGARTLRGYREEQFLGSRIGWVNLELRYWLGPLSRVFVFADGGGVFRERVLSDVKQQSTLYRTAVGLGLRLETNLGVWGIDYGVGEEDRLLDGKLHVSLLSSF